MSAGSICHSCKQIVPSATPICRRCYAIFPSTQWLLGNFLARRVLRWLSLRGGYGRVLMFPFLFLAQISNASQLLPCTFWAGVVRALLYSCPTTIPSPHALPGPTCLWNMTGWKSSERSFAESSISGVCFNDKTIYLAFVQATTCRLFLPGLGGHYLQLRQLSWKWHTSISYFLWQIKMLLMDSSASPRTSWLCVITVWVFFFCCLFRYVALPLAKVLDIKNVRRVKPQPNSVLEAYFQSCTRHPSQVRIPFLFTGVWGICKVPTQCFNQLSTMVTWDGFQEMDKWLNPLWVILLPGWQGIWYS